MTTFLTKIMKISQISYSCNHKNGNKLYSIVFCYSVYLRANGLSKSKF